MAPLLASPHKKFEDSSARTGGKPMRATLLAASLAALVYSPVISAQTLSGQVTSNEEGAMEGVLVSAKLAGSHKTVTVVTDEKGHYAFPQGRLEPGKHALTIRAVGYDLAAASTAEVPAKGSAT